MSIFSKYALLLPLTILLAFFGVAEGVCEKGTPTALTSSVGEEKTESAFSQSGHIRFKFLHKASEQVISPVNSQPVPNAENPGAGFINVAAAFEHSMQQLVAQYLSKAKSICLSLASTAIIFPFHQFW
jgi:hypothetical protein